MYAAADEEEIPQHFGEDPTILKYIVANRLGMGYTKVWFTVLSKPRFPLTLLSITSYYTPLHVNEVEDPINKLNFRKILHCAIMEDILILLKILWTNET